MIKKNSSQRLFTFLCISLVAAGIALVSGAARADDPQLIGVFKSWEAYRAREEKSAVCYTLTKRITPKKQDKLFKHRGQVMLQVTNRPADGSRNVVSYVAGHGLKGNDSVMLGIDKQKFSLKPSGDTAWAKSNADDAAITQALRGGHSIYVTHIYKKQAVTDVFSPSGATAAIDAIGDCK